MIVERGRGGAVIWRVSAYNSVGCCCFASYGGQVQRGRDEDGELWVPHCAEDIMVDAGPVLLVSGLVWSVDWRDTLEFYLGCKVRRASASASAEIEVGGIVKY